VAHARDDRALAARFSARRHANPHDDDHWKFVFITLGWTLSIGIASAITYFVERPLLGTIRPQSFAFDWQRLGLKRSAPIARRETRT